MQVCAETLESILNRLKESIKKKNLKNSKQREAVIATLYRARSHLSPEEITSIIKEDNKAVSISSVYRILLFLQEEGFVRVLDIDKQGKRYEIQAKAHHDHIICLQCGAIQEFVNPIIESIQIQISEEHQARLISHDLRLFVVCKRCEDKNRLKIKEPPKKRGRKSTKRH